MKVINALPLILTIGIVLMLYTCEKEYTDDGTKVIDSLKVEISKAKANVKTITETKYIKVKEAQKLPPVKRDSMFLTITDTVKVPRDVAPITIESWRVSAANGLFKELEITKAEVVALTQVIAVQDSIISEQDRLIKILQKENKRLRRWWIPIVRCKR